MITTDPNITVTFYPGHVPLHRIGTPIGVMAVVERIERMARIRSIVTARAWRRARMLAHRWGGSPKQYIGAALQHSWRQQVVGG